MEKKTPDESRRPAEFGTDTGELAERYEQLRQEVLAEGVGSRLGLSVLQHQGVVGWMRVQSFLRATLAPRGEPVMRPKSWPNELTTILTNLILEHKEIHA